MGQACCREADNALLHQRTKDKTTAGGGHPVVKKPRSTYSPRELQKIQHANPKMVSTRRQSKGADSPLAKKLG